MSEKVLNDIFLLKELERKLIIFNSKNKEKNDNVNNLDIDIETNTGMVFDLYKTIFSDLKKALDYCNSKENSFCMRKIRSNIDRLETMNNYIKDQLEKYSEGRAGAMTLDENTYRIQFCYPYGENGINSAEFHNNMDAMIRRGKDLIEYGRNAVNSKEAGRIINFEYSIVFLQLDLYNVFGAYFGNN